LARCTQVGRKARVVAEGVDHGDHPDGSVGNAEKGPQVALEALYDPPTQFAENRARRVLRCARRV